MGSNRLIKILAILSVLMLCIKLIFLNQNTLTHFDATVYTFPAKNLMEKGISSIEENKMIYHADKDYYFCGKLFQYLQVIIYFLFGYNIFTIKLVPFIAYVVSGFFIYGIGKKVISKEAGVLSLCLWYLLPTFIFRFVERPESLQICFMLLTVYYFYRIKENPTTLQLVACGSISGISLWIHPTTCFVSVVTLGLLAITNIQFRRLPWIIAGQLLMLGFYVLIFFIPNYTPFTEQFYEAGIVWMDTEALVREGAVIHRISRELSKIWNFFTLKQMIPFTILWIVSVILTCRKTPQFYTRFFFPLVPGVLISSYMSIHVPTTFYYMMYLLPALVLAIALFIQNLNPVRLKTGLIGMIVLYFIGTQIAITYIRRNTSFSRLAGSIASKIGNTDSPLLAPEPYNIIWNSNNFYGFIYYDFWVSIQKHPDLMKKYEHVYGGSFENFLKKNNIRYVVLDVNTMFCKELEEKIKDKSAMIFDEESEYGMAYNKRVRVYKLADSNQ
ncbi:MAG: glycosyltransferase family 39 protein [Planctomycetes bacterium]|nr:glycosyltransferase family 39 protein [Planctomycetota bacterium]